jgi:hypothetical protein
MKKVALTVVAFVVLVGSAHAAGSGAPRYRSAGSASRSAGYGSAGYGTAGCGLGSIVFEGKTGMVQIFAGTTNATLGTQTFGISSGTSNCGGGGAAPSVNSYIEVNREALANDIARGKGETLNGLSQLVGCEDDAKVGPVLQKNYERIFPGKQVSAAEIEATITPMIEGSCS